jgi:prolyl-tRNA editing enzyme YbaK/EbsC (Cys-tRNA(Pro) deacylase)
MDSADLAAFIAANGITAEIIRLPDHTPTVEVAAQALGVRIEQVVKSILFLAEGSPVLVIANGTNRIDYRRLGDYLNLSRKRIKMADADQVLDIAGYIVGSMPPFGHKTRLRTLIDARMFEQPEVFAGGGDINAILRVAADEIMRVTGGERVEVSGSE